jgi:ribosome recycling factor
MSEEEYVYVRNRTYAAVILNALREIGSSNDDFVVTSDEVTAVHNTVEKWVRDYHKMLDALMDKGKSS